MNAQTTPAAIPTEQELREATVPWFDTIDELVAYIKSLTEREHDYGTAVYATSMAAVAAFQFAARKGGITGFQASCADMDVLRRTRHMNGPFMLIRGEDALYPQYNVAGKVAEFLADIRPWLATEAANKLTSTHEVHPDVRAHWLALAETPQERPA